MDLIYSNNNVEIGVLQKFALDFESSTDKDKNTFEVECPIDSNPLNIGYYIFVENSEIGGIIDSIKLDTAKQLAYLDGRSWRGVLGSKILEPPLGQSHYVVSGDINDILAEIITKIGLSDLFVADITASGQTVTNYQFARYTDAYTGIVKLLSSLDLKLNIYHYKGFVHIKAVPINDYTAMSQLTSDTFDFVIQKRNPTANHMIGLGSGELTERMVIHKYLQPDGSISDIQYYFGVDEVVAVYDNSNTESIEDLTASTIEELEKCSVEDSIDIKSYNLDADLGDKFLAHDNVTGLSVTQYVVDKITNIDEDVVKIQYKVGGGI